MNGLLFGEPTSPAGAFGYDTMPVYADALAALSPTGAARDSAHKRA